MRLAFLLILQICLLAFADEDIEKYSSLFIGKPYFLGALGEGSGIDSKPRHRTDRFDCTTYIETVMAMSARKNQQSLVDVLDEIRYENGVVHFTNRNHFISTEWIPRNEKAGFVKDITHQLFTSDVKYSSTVIDRKAWFKKLYGIDVSSDVEESKLPFIESKKFHEDKALLDKIPSGAVVSFVTPSRKLIDKIGTDYDVSHQGFLIRKSDGELYLRHASRTRGRVIEESFADYLKRFTDRNEDGGINLLEVLQKQ